MRTTESPIRSALALVAAALALACGGAFAATMTRAEYSAQKDRIEADHKVAEAACARQKGNAKEICEEEAEGREEVAKAELEANYTGKPEDRRKLAEIRAKATYEVAEERCDDRSGNAKDVCVAEAKAVLARAQADIKLAAESGKLRNEAAKTRDEAGYKAEAEKCDSLSGDARSACMTSARARFNMN
ncbi:MAG TPA: hypothetical protein VFR90_03070 [Methylibium sp.]|uniref:hypothetical protein n=1 Tax=Methylibium sp. TaxID=2067992 RepID=UPI002DBC1512|nr:hypothetical protein [Methylibium sp.]HEU4458083.1 hypothetical protein [Methylibium sp.]